MSSNILYQGILSLSMKKIYRWERQFFLTRKQASILVVFVKNMGQKILDSNFSPFALKEHSLSDSEKKEALNYVENWPNGGKICEYSPWGLAVRVPLGPQPPLWGQNQKVPYFTNWVHGSFHP